LKADPAVRKNLAKRFQSRAHDKDFRNGLVANLSSHPEWDRILYPEKYLPKSDKSLEKSQ
ncbi:MAG: hypothetical protein WBM28_12195, partial [Burkholderiales bacterium]